MSTHKTSASPVLAPLDELRAKIGFDVPDELLVLAMTHPSAVGEGLERTLKSNQRLEFLGDTIVGAIVAEHLYRIGETLPEGELTQRKAASVRGETLERAARRLDLGRWLRLGRGEETSGGRTRGTILSDTFEALSGALFMAGGWECARRFALEALREELDEVANEAAGAPFSSIKNLLQERTQAIGLGTPRYQTAQSSGSHGERRFSSQVFLQDEVRGRGTGRSKKEAESNAAQAAFDAMNAQ